MRALTARIHNAIANQPEVFPFVCNDPSLWPLCFDELAADPENYVLLHNGESDDDLSASAAMLFEWSGPGMWQMHTMFTKHCRGRDAMKQGAEFIRYMFEDHGADTIWGQTPLDNKAARFFNRKLGGISRGLGTHHVFGPVEFFRTSRDEWKQHTS